MLVYSFMYIQITYTMEISQFSGGDQIFKYLKIISLISLFCLTYIEQIDYVSIYLFIREIVVVIIGLLP